MRRSFREASNATPRRFPSALLVVLLGLGCKVSGSLDLGGGAKETRPADSGGAPTTSMGTGTAVTPAVRIVRVGDKLMYENGEIEFETGSAAIKVGSSEVINEFADVLQRYPELVVVIEGHTDSRGSTESNQRLSEERAVAIQAALARRGVARERMSTVGFGESKPERSEPLGCRNKSEDSVAADKLATCKAVWDVNRRAAFVVTKGAETLPSEGTHVNKPTAMPEPTPEPTPVAKAPGKRRPDWALRFFGGYTLMLPGQALHGGHFGVGLHASQRFGARGRGYIGGGPRLHYRGVHRRDVDPTTLTETTVHQFGPEGNLLVGGGSHKVVGLFSMRLGLGLSALRGRETTVPGVVDTRTNGLGGWALGGVTVLGKLSPWWSLGGHAEGGVAGVTGADGALGLAGIVEVGLNLAWHFGKGRRDGI